MKKIISIIISAVMCISCLGFMPETFLNPQNSTLKTATQPERLFRTKSGIKMHVKSR